jgi:hypothetical protein
MFDGQSQPCTRIPGILWRLDAGGPVRQLAVDPLGDQEIDSEWLGIAVSQARAHAEPRAQLKRSIYVQDGPLLADLNSVGASFEKIEIDGLQFRQQVVASATEHPAAHH